MIGFTLQFSNLGSVVCQSAIVIYLYDISTSPSILGGTFNNNNNINGD